MKAERPQIDLEQIDTLASELAELYARPIGRDVQTRELYFDAGDGTEMHLMYDDVDNWEIITHDVEDAKRGGTYVHERRFDRDRSGLEVMSISSLGYDSSHNAGPVTKLRAYLALTCLREQIELQDQ